MMRLAFDRAVPLSYVAMSDPLPQEAAEQIKAALAAGNKIEAIKIYRTFSGASLAEAKDFIEALAAGRAPVVPSRPEVAPGAIEDALFAGKKSLQSSFTVRSTAAGLPTPSSTSRRSKRSSAKHRRNALRRKRAVSSSAPRSCSRQRD